MLLKKIALCLFAFCAVSATAQNTDNINCLKFASTAQYEQTVDAFTTNGLSSVNGFSSYTSIKSTFVAEQPPAGFNEEQPADDYDVSQDQSTYNEKDYFNYDFLSQVLNTDKLVIIGNWIVKIDLVNDRALLLNKNFASQYNDLLNDNLANTNILNFSLEDDGVEMMNQLDNGVPMASLKLWCSDRSAASGKDDRFAYVSSRRRLDMKVVYQRAFIYFSLEGKAKTQKRFLRIWWHDGSGNAAMSYINLAYEVRCKNRGFQYTGDPCKFGCLAGYSAGSTCSYRPYSSTRALKKYLYAIDFVSTHGNGHVEIKDGY